MAVSWRMLGLFLCISCVSYIFADRAPSRGVVRKLLREMVNQTKADTLNLPANATSIRENITDTFSCENRTYGYYADVDNECQVFHVCLTSQTTSGRNVTYRWSFICPNETIFNQEVLTCTRPIDSIECDESPMFYHVNMDIGKIPNDTDTQVNPGNSTRVNNRIKPIKKQNLIVENLMKEVKKANLVTEVLEDDLAPVIEEISTDDGPFTEEFDKIAIDDELKDAVEEESLKEPTTEKVIKKVVLNNVSEVMKEPVIRKVDEEYTMKGKRMEDARLYSERSLKRFGRKINRGSFRFKADRPV